MHSEQRPTDNTTPLSRRYRTLPVDLSDVYDFAPADVPCEFRGGRGPGDGVRAESLCVAPAAPAASPVRTGFTIAGHPGLVVVPGALSAEQQVIT